MAVVWCVFQSVTAVESTDDHNSYWRVRSKIGSNCVRGWAMYTLCMGGALRLSLGN